MRMNPGTKTTAAFLVNTLPEGELAGIFRDFGEERNARRIARRIVSERKREPIRTTGRLAGIIVSAMPRGAARQKIDPATRVFMALRIAVNRELEILERFMLNAVDFLNPHGRLCVLSFHSLEDRIVKHRFKALEKGCICPPELPLCACGRKPAVRILFRKGLHPSEAEIAGNPPARSARLRGVEKR
jgi:16S rRNA (cytosine1402-N4)-methyltransferase